MTVKELIEKLKAFDQEAEIEIQYYSNGNMATFPSIDWDITIYEDKDDDWKYTNRVIFDLGDWDDWVENRKDYLFDDLNNILFEKHSELTEYIKEWLTEHKLANDSMIVWELASEFIDKKELYDLDYED